jgi:hypothetical protein
MDAYQNGSISENQLQDILTGAKTLDQVTKENEDWAAANEAYGSGQISEDQLKAIGDGSLTLDKAINDNNSETAGADAAATAQWDAMVSEATKLESQGAISADELAQVQSGEADLDAIYANRVSDLADYGFIDPQTMGDMLDNPDWGKLASTEFESGGFELGDNFDPGTFDLGSLDTGGFSTGGLDAGSDPGGFSYDFVDTGAVDSSYGYDMSSDGGGDY